MYLDTTILQSRTTTTLVEFIDELINSQGLNSRLFLTDNELYHKYQEIKKQHKKAKKLDGRGKNVL